MRFMLQSNALCTPPPSERSEDGGGGAPRLVRRSSKSEGGSGVTEGALATTQHLFTPNES
jgi:hypothetical protein